MAKFYDASLQVVETAPPQQSDLKTFALSAVAALVSVGALAFAWQASTVDTSAAYTTSALRPVVTRFAGVHRPLNTPATNRRAIQVPAQVQTQRKSSMPPLRATAEAAAAAYSVPWGEIRRDLTALVKETNAHPILVRLAWHDAGTYDKESKTGGPRAAQRFEGGEAAHGANAGLDIARDLLDPIKEKYPSVTYADLWALGSIVGIEVSGGPAMPFRPGRSDAKSAKESVEDGRLPDATQGPQHLRDVFYRMGLDDKGIVALSGAHTLGRAHKDRSGFEGPWTEKPLVFDNSYFTDLLNKKWTLGEASTGQPQYWDEKKEQMMLISDIALLEDAEFKKLVELYAADQTTYFQDFSDAYTKLVELGIPKVEAPWDHIRSDVEKLVKEKGCAPILVRLAWHDAGTYDSKNSKNSGGPRAAQRFTESGESTHGANAGLDIARGLLQPIVDKYPGVSVSDIWAFASVVATEVSGGPKIPFQKGRKDVVVATQSVEDGRLPDATQGADHLRDVFYRQGMDDADIVALSGAHTLGACHKDRSGFEGPWTTQPLKFDNEYFKNLLERKWTLKTNSVGNEQYEDETGALMMLKSDMALIEDEKMKPVVEKFAADEAAFFKQYASAYQKLVEGGCPYLASL